MVKRSSVLSEPRRAMLRDGKHDGFRLSSVAHCSPLIFWIPDILKN
jgi:hypothetical protein